MLEKILLQINETVISTLMIIIIIKNIFFEYQIIILGLSNYTLKYIQIESRYFKL